MKMISRLKKFFSIAGGKELVLKYVYNHVLLYALIVFAVVSKTRVGLEQLREIVNEKIFLKLKRKYKKLIVNFDIKSNDSIKPKIIWFCWFQGIENAPAIVKASLNSIRKYATNYEIRIITKNNYKDFIDFPSFIIEKWEKGIITNTHFSDILRVSLLEKYGGTWIDSTCILTSSIPSDIEDANLFMFKNYKPASDALVSTYTSWFISSGKNNPVMKIAQSILYSYWKKKNFLCDYFFIFYIFQMIYDLRPDLFVDIPKYPIETAHFMFFGLKENMNERIFESYCKQIFIHKMSYKYMDNCNENVKKFYLLLEKRK